MQSPIQLEISRHDLLISSAATVAVTGVAGGVAPAQSAKDETAYTSTVSFRVNGQHCDIDVDDSARRIARRAPPSHGHEKGCDHGQCGARTVIVDGRRVNSCLTLAVMHEGDEITSIRTSPSKNHALPAAKKLLPTAAASAVNVLAFCRSIQRSKEQ